MNLAWVVPRSGRATARNLHAKDRTRLAREGFLLYRLEWITVAGTRAADVYAQRPPTVADLLGGADALYAAQGEGALRLLDASGSLVLSSE